MCRRVIRALSILRKLRNGDGGKDADDGHHDHQLDEREALLALLGGELVEHCCSSNGLEVRFGAGPIVGRAALIGEAKGMPTD